MSKTNDKFYYSRQFDVHGSDLTQDLGKKPFYFLNNTIFKHKSLIFLVFPSEFHSFFQNEMSNFGNLTQLPSSTLQRQSISPQRQFDLTKYELDEPPLLDELEIYPERIMQKSIAILNPFHYGDADNDDLISETDLAGPIIFCLIFGVCLFLSGSKVHFGYIYGLSVISVLGMYMLISLMCHRNDHTISLYSVASTLGYGILPIIWFTVIGIFLPLNSFFGFIMACGTVYLSTAGASRLFCLMIGNPEQRFLIAYPCALVYTVFTILAVF